MLHYTFLSLFFFTKLESPSRLGCRILRLHLCRRVRLPPVSLLDMILNHVMVTLFEDFGNVLENTPITLPVCSKTKRKKGS